MILRKRKGFISLLSSPRPRPSRGRGEGEENVGMSSSRRYPLYDVPLPTNITITTTPSPSPSPSTYVSTPPRRPTALTTTTTSSSAPLPPSPYPFTDPRSDRNATFSPHHPNNLFMNTTSPFTNPHSRQEVGTSSTGGVTPHFFSPNTTTTTTMFTPPTMISPTTTTTTTTTSSGVDINDMEHHLSGINMNTFLFDNMNNMSTSMSSAQAPADSHTTYITPPPPPQPPQPTSTPLPPQPALAKVPLYFLHPVPNSNILTVMKCMQPVAQDILIDSREVSPHLPLLGCFFICTMEEREILSIFPMSKPILRWGIYHKLTRNLLFSSFYRFNCAFGAKGYFTYDAFIDKGHFGFGQEEIFVQQEDVKEKLWKMCLTLLREKFGVQV